jgi:hypothetical protein
MRSARSPLQCWRLVDTLVSRDADEALMIMHELAADP